MPANPTHPKNPARLAARRIHMITKDSQSGETVKASRSWKKPGNVSAARHSRDVNYDIPDVVSELAHGQAGAISRRQLLTAGLTVQMIDTRLERRRWQMLHRGVYAVFSGPPSRDTLLWAAVLRVGDGGVLSHQTAAELHGLIDSPSEAIHVTVPATRRVTTPGSSSAFPAASTRPRSSAVSRSGQPSRRRCLTSLSWLGRSMMPAVGLPEPAVGGLQRRKSSARPWRHARKCAGGPS